MINALLLVTSAAAAQPMVDCGTANMESMYYVAIRSQPTDTGPDYLRYLLEYTEFDGQDILSDAQAWEIFEASAADNQLGAVLSDPSTTLSSTARTMISQYWAAISNGLPLVGGGPPSASYAAARPSIEAQLTSISNGLPLLSSFERRVVECVGDIASNQVRTSVAYEAFFQARGLTVDYAGHNESIRAAVYGAAIGAATSGTNGSEVTGQGDLTATAMVVGSTLRSLFLNVPLSYSGYGPFHQPEEDDPEKQFYQSVREALAEIARLLDPAMVQGPVAGEVPPPWNGQSGPF